MLHVQKLSTNLFSIHQITKDFNFTITFFPSHCAIQDRATRRMIGHAKEQEGLYLLGFGFGNGDCMLLSHFSKKFSLNKVQIWLHHLCLGKSSFSLLKKMFLLSFNKLDVSNFHCEVCQFAKHHRVLFPLHNTKSTSSCPLSMTVIR